MAIAEAVTTKAEPSFKLRIFRQLDRWFHPPRRAMPTRPGWFVLAVPLVLGVAAVSASNNLLFLLVGASLGAVTLSGVLSERNIRHIRLVVRAKGAVYAGENSQLCLEFTRGRSQVKDEPCFDLAVRERRTWFLRGSKVMAFSAHLPVLENRSATVDVACCFERRGRAHLPSLELSTCYPFGLLRKARDVSAEGSIVVRPKKIVVPGMLVSPLQLLAEGSPRVHKGGGTEIAGLRERQEWESMSRVHALRSLALDKDVVLETEPEIQNCFDLGLFVGPGADSLAFEHLLELAQAVVESWTSHGFELAVHVGEHCWRSNQIDLSALLDQLALLNPEHLTPRMSAQSGVLWLVAGRAPSEITTPYVHVKTDGSNQLVNVSS